LIRASTYNPVEEASALAPRTAARHLTARDAARALGVRLPTLYAYASRGMLRSEPAPGEPRARLYPREDVDRLRARRDARSNPERAAEAGLHWGSPVLASALTLIEGGRLRYRGRDALDLAREATLEEVAALLWTGDARRAGALFSGAPPGVPRGLGALARGDGLGPVERCQIALPLAASADLGAYDLRPAAVAATGARIFRLLVAVVAGVPWRGTAEGTLQAAWAPRRPATAGALRAALILCADHELNVSAFTARCVASAGANPYDVVAAGLAALKGARHGGESARVEALLQEAEPPRGARAAIAGRLRRGEALPGFGHPLYPAGDPRGAALLALSEEAARGPRAMALVRAVVAAAAELVGEPPTLDLGLAALARALRLPEGSPLALFALGRTLGWIGHAIEQYADGRLIRPRARYVGERPVTSSGASPSLPNPREE
jgi:citrate synthase